MICIFQIYGDIQDFTSIADTFLFELREIATIYGSEVSKAKVCIKVCNINS